MNMMHDVTKIPKEQAKREYLARLMTNVLYVFIDCLESMYVETEQVNRKCGYQLRHEEKHSFNKIFAEVKKIRRITRELPESEQVSYGDDADQLLDLVYLAVTRTGTDNQLMHRFIEYVGSFPDRLGLDEAREGGETFKALKKAGILR